MFTPVVIHAQHGGQRDKPKPRLARYLMRYASWSGIPGDGSPKSSGSRIRRSSPYCHRRLLAVSATASKLQPPSSGCCARKSRLSKPRERSSRRAQTKPLALLAEVHQPRRASAVPRQAVPPLRTLRSPACSGCLWLFACGLPRRSKALLPCPSSVAGPYLSFHR